MKRFGQGFTILATIAVLTMGCKSSLESPSAAGAANGGSGAQSVGKVASATYVSSVGRHSRIS
jgi:hypothetical protein